MDWVKEKMLYQARDQRNRLQAQGPAASPGNPLKGDPEVATTRLSQFLTETHKLSWLTGGMALGGMIVIMVWWADLINVGDGVGVNGVAGGVSEQHRQLVELQAQFSTTEEMRKDLIQLTGQVQVLTASVSDLEVILLHNHKVQVLTASVSDLEVILLHNHTVTGSITALGNKLASETSQQQGTASGTISGLKILPPPAAGKRNASASDGKDTDKSGDTASSTLVATKEHAPIATGIQAQETIRDSGLWVINLVSLTHKAAAERFMAKAESRGVTAGLYQMTVRGKDYWRVQVSGFTTAAEAKAKANLVKEKLELKDVWVAKR
jgi:cell division septation protein DedD